MISTQTSDALQFEGNTLKLADYELGRLGELFDVDRATALLTAAYGTVSAVRALPYIKAALTSQASENKALAINFYRMEREMDERALRILAKLSSVSEPPDLSDEDAAYANSYLGLDALEGASEFKIASLREELLGQNQFLTNHIDDTSVAESETFKKSQYVRDICNRRVQNKFVGRKLDSERYRASLDDVERSLLTLRDVVFYPLHIASETEDERVVRFVGEIADFIFRKVQVEFKELAKRLDDKSPNSPLPL